MAGPWEKYAASPAPAPQGPWTRYGAKTNAALPADDSLSELRTMTGGLIEGLPVVGPIIRGGVERAAAATIAPFSVKTYGEVLETIQKGSEAEKAANPILDTGSQIVGGVAGTVPLVMAAPAAFGAGAGSLGAQTAASTVSGGILGAADAGVRSGGDPKAALRGAEWGAGLGFLGPAAGRLVGAGTSALMNRFRPTATASQALIGEAAIADAISDPAARMSQLGPQAMAMDLGPNLQQTAAGLASVPGEAQQTIRTAVRNRDMGANARIQNELDTSLGVARDPSAVETGIRSNMDVVAEGYEPLFQGASSADPTRIARTLDLFASSKRGPAQQAAQKLRGMLDQVGGEGLDTNPRTLFEVRNAIDGLMDGEANGKVINVLKLARNQVDNELSRVVPGIKDVDAQFAELARQKEAFTRGQQALDSGRTAVRPRELSQEVSEGALPQGTMIGPSAVPLRMREGTRAEIERIVGTNANDRVALQRLIKGEGDWNRARLEIQFGRDRAKTITDLLDAERAFADTSQIVTRNSETARRSAAQEALTPDEPKSGVLRSAANLNFGDAASVPIDAVRAARMRAQAVQVQSELAEILSSNSPERIKLAIQAVQQAKARGDITKQAAKAATNSILSGNSGKIGTGTEIPIGMPLQITVRPSP